MTTQQRITLKAVKHAEFASEETPCYEANVYFDGKLFAKVSNEGRGGCDSEYVTNPAVYKAARDYIDTLPPAVTEYDDPKVEGQKFTYPRSLETECHRLLDLWLAAKDLKRAMKNKWLFQREPKGGIYAIKRLPSGETADMVIKALRQTYPAANLLNALPEAEALDLYVEFTAPR